MCDRDLNVARRHTLEGDLITSRFYIHVFGKVQGECCSCASPSDPIPIILLPPFLNDGSISPVQATMISEGDTPPNVHVGTVISIQPFPTAPPPTFSFSSSTQDDEFNDKTPLLHQDMEGKVDDYSSLTSSSNNFSRLVEEVRGNGLGLQQKELIQNAISSGEISTLTCSQVLQLVEMINIDLHRKDVIVNCYPIISDKENFETHLMTHGISSLYHDEIRNGINWK